MVDEFCGIDADGVSTTRFEVREDNIFVDGGEFGECGIIEHIAQSAAARVGYICRRQEREVPLGYIGSVNNLSIVRLPRTGECLQTGIKVLQEVFGVSLIEAVCRAGGEVVAGCRMKIFLEQ